MHRAPPASRGRAGMTLIEMLIALALFLIVIVGMLRLVGEQPRGGGTGTERHALAQNPRVGVEQVAQEIRSAGANTGEGQPEIVYAGPGSFAFNADYLSNLPYDIAAVHIDPDAPAARVSSLRRSRAIVVPGSSPPFTYPSADYTTGGILSSAETITYHFSPDPETARTDDFALWRRWNDQPDEIVARNILRTPGLPFFSYLRLVRHGPGLRLDTIPAAWLPLRHTAALHGGPADTAAAGRIDSLRAVRLTYTVTNGLPAARERRRPTSLTIPLPRLGMVKVQPCGDEPMHGQLLVALPGGDPRLPSVELRWHPAVDESAGEHDVMRYVIWRRLATDPDWGTPFASVPSGHPGYTYSDSAVDAGKTYVYSVSAQDCTPELSARSISAAVTVP